MATIDWIILGVLGISTLISARRGFVKEALSLVTWLAAIVIARLFASQLAVLLEPYIATSSFRQVASYLILFVGTLMVGGLLNALLSEFVKMTGLSSTDRFLGMFFGLARGGIVVGLVVAGLHYLSPFGQDPWYTSSLLIPEIVVVLEELGPLVWAQGEQLFDGSKVIDQSS